MTREEMIKSFANAPGRCKMQCPYQKQCHNSDFCVFKEAALIIAADQEKIRELTEQARTMRDLVKIIHQYAKYMEERCFDYYKMIHDYNGGVEKKLWIPPKRRLATMRRRKTVAAKKKALRDRTLMDGDPQYAQPSSPPQEKIEEVLV